MENTLLDHYLAYIGVQNIKTNAAFSSQPAEQILADVETIIQAHTCTIPFANFLPLIGETFEVDIQSVEEALLDDKTGGYCHQHSPLFRTVLQELGLSCRPVLARVYANPDKPTAGGLTHQSTIVEIGGEDFIVDPGFGGGTPTVAVPLREAARGEIGEERKNQFGTYRAVPASYALPAEKVADCSIVIQVKSPGTESFRNLYGFRDNDWEAADLELSNWFTMTRPGGIFTENLMVALNLPSGGRKTLSNRKLRIVERGENPSEIKRDIHDAEDFKKILQEEFGIYLEEDALDKAWEKLSAS